ncbi:nucleolar and spindle-associated protein 1 isoform X1 [Anguilla anguilla]|uniref:nucleolar and spindle-associated protein 1 isoform X1 n=1 Tax=Anguilla anguilla TaxID=7936 RepID=UPI0015B1A1C5|nr:nucleolar and spindle-associated protein 1 isoform X1 [Anguilla anguilla]
MDLDSLKYADLQRLAKDIGLKANMKAEKLLKALKQHYKQQSPTENAEGGISGEEEDTDASQHLPSYDSAAFVTDRRARGQKGKRKQLEAEESVAEISGSMLQSPTQTVEESGKATEGQGSAKRRKVSAEEDCGTGLMEECSEETVLQSCTMDGGAEGPVGGEDPKTAKPVGKIPRHEGLLKKMNRPVLKPTTPNFKKLHEAHFNKMESIDSYLQRKNKQMETIRNPVKELKMLSEKANIIKPVEKKAAPKPKASRASLFSPVTQGRRSVADKRRLTQLSASKPALKNSSSFKPTVVSTRRMNVSFSQTTRDNEHKRSLVKTPARMSPHVDLVSTPTGQAKPEVKKPAVSTTKTPVASSTQTPGVTPFVFNGNTSISNTPGTQKKNTFDLKASLSRPLSYQPHKGKLKPFADVKENAALNTTQPHQKNYKTHQVQTRVERRARHTEDRKQKKEKILGARRGLAMS